MTSNGDRDRTTRSGSPRAPAALERAGRLSSIVTQNIDGLHQLSGSDEGRVIELHGTARRIVCLDCGARYDPDEIHERVTGGDLSPRCDACAGLLKPDTISFGQNLDTAVLERAFEEARSCDLFLVVGSTLVVQPAASLPVEAKASGAQLAILDLSETPLDDEADLVIRGRAGEILPAAVEEMGC